MDRLSSTTLLPDALQGTRDDISEQLGVVWSQIKAPVIVPLMSIAVAVCLAMSLMLFFERVYLSIVIVLVKLFGRKPDKRYKWEPMKDDVELGNSAYPMVLVQIPMYNEKEVLSLAVSFCGLLCFSKIFCLVSVLIFLSLFHTCQQVYQLSIGAACGLSWPSDRIIIQVLDDSTDPTIKVSTSNSQNIPIWGCPNNLDEKNAGLGGARMSEMGKQRHKHQVRDKKQQKWVQSRSSQGGNETQLR